MSDPWVRCEVCGDRMKRSRLEGHMEEVHPGGAATEQEREQVRKRKERRRRVKVGALVVLAVTGMAAGGYLLAQVGDPEPKQLSADGEPYLGSSQANLTVYLFEDYQCPHCARFETQGGFDHLRSEWIEPGHVRLVFKDFPFIGPDSNTAAQASQCVWSQAPGEWLSWHRMVFENQGREGSGWASQNNLQALTEEWGRVDPNAFEECLDSSRWREEVTDDRQEGKKASVSGTPQLVVGDRVVNPLATEEVDDAIRAALGSA